jgi:hypothetical protein
LPAERTSLRIKKLRKKFLIKTRDFSNDEFDSSEAFMKNHCVYILENGKDAYIGETKDMTTK